jgi:hypothetical protein
MKIELKYVDADNGNCRVYYRNGRRLYCWQMDSLRPVTWRFYVCSKDGEPSHEADPLAFEIPFPVGHERIELELSDYLNQLG